MIVFIFWPIRLHSPVPYSLLAVLLRWQNKWSQERYEPSLVMCLVLIPRLPDSRGLGVRLLSHVLSPIMMTSYCCLWLFLCSSEMELQLSGESILVQGKKLFLSWFDKRTSLCPNNFLPSFSEERAGNCSHTLTYVSHPHTLTGLQVTMRRLIAAWAFVFSTM